MRARSQQWESPPSSDPRMPQRTASGESLDRPESSPCRNPFQDDSTMTDSLADYLQPLPLIAVLRGITPAEVAPVSAALVAEGFRILEVPLNSPQPFNSIRALAAMHGKRCLIGAGTVLNVEDVARVK